MNVAFCIYDGMTVLDFVGAYDPITRLDRMEFTPVSWDICAQTEFVTTNQLEFHVDRVEPGLGDYDLMVVRSRVLLVFAPFGMLDEASGSVRSSEEAKARASLHRSINGTITVNSGRVGLSVHPHAGLAI